MSRTRDAFNRGDAVGLVFLAAGALLPWVANDYVLTVATMALYLALFGQAWNILAGFAGQLSLGHALFVGLGAYASAALYVQFGVSPWLALPVAVATAAIVGAAIGFLAFRFKVSGVHFAILTVAFAEMGRTAFDHLDALGGAAGLFLPVSARSDALQLRGGPALFYGVLLALTAGLFLACRRLLRSRWGYYWQAIRESTDAAQALGIDVFRYKMRAMVVSAAAAAMGGVVFAFQYNSLFPGQVFDVSRSVEIILGAIIGGLGTLAGPLVGAAVLTLLGELLREGMRLLGIDIPGVKHVFYGACLLVVMIGLPQGIWPAIRSLALSARRARP